MTGPSSPGRKAQPGQRPDADLIAAARRGDNVALDQLIARHRKAANRLARRLAPDSADRLLAESVATVTATLRAGGGPAVAFRPYLLTTIRRRNHARAVAAGRIRPVDDLGTTRMASVGGSRVTPAALPAASAVHRRLSELTRAALWHTEVDGEELEATAVLVGLPATEVAELAFRGRDAFRQGTLGAYLASTAGPTCRWSAERFGAYGRQALGDGDTAKIEEHLGSCESCRSAYPAVEAVENDLPVLLAMLVLGPAAAPYLGRDLVPAGRGQAAARPRALAGVGGRSAAVLGVGIFLAGGGLLTSLALAGDDGSTDRAQQAPPAAVAEVEVEVEDDEGGDGSLLESEGPDSGSASTGGERPLAVERDAAPASRSGGALRTAAETRTTTPTTRTLVKAPVTVAPSVDPTSAEEPQAAAEAAADPEAPVAERRVLADLGIVELAVTPDGGLLPGLPGIGLLPPDA